MAQHGAAAASSTSARSPTPITEEKEEDDDSSSAYGQAIRRIMLKTSEATQWPQLNIPLGQLGRPTISVATYGAGQPSCGQYAEANYNNDNRSSAASLSELNYNDTSSLRHSIIIQSDYESRSLYSISECEASNSPALQFNHRYGYTYSGSSGTELQSAYNKMLQHNQFDTETSFISQAMQANNACNRLPEFGVSGRALGLKLAPQVGELVSSGKKKSFIKRKLDRARTTSPQVCTSSEIKMRAVRQRSSTGSNNCEQDYHHNKHRSNFSGCGGNQRADEKGTTESAEDNDLHTKWSWRNLKREFKLSHSESLFHLYQAKLQQSFFVALLILNIIFNLGAVISYLISKYHQMNTYLILMRLASIWVMVAFLILIWHNKLWMQSKFSRTVASHAVLLAMIFGEASGAICALMNDQATPLASIRRTYYLIITNHVFLPYPTRIQACASTIIITSFEIVVTYISRRDNNCRADYLRLYSIADIIFYASSAMIGFQITFLLEIAIRRTFLNHKYCIQSTYKLNYEKEQQEQLLRSCFPQHLIEQVRADIRQSIAIISKRQSQPFRPFYNLYVKKYSNVTILYADIVNSMNLTDKLNPPELVETLNELYGRFDELAEKFNCLRIKLLGDCYYCVSGLPEYDADHALKCLLMGLGMIKIIQSIRQSRNVDIDMRIGIHSGSVLSGLLGLRKWQFDIWSFDAMKASSMEHNGQPGFVHITQRTLDLISKDHAKMQDLIITATRQSDDCETTYLISERVCQNERAESARASHRGIGQSEKLKAYIEKLRLRPTASAMDFTQRRMALESSLKKYREIHEKVDETMKTAIADMPLGSAWKQLFFVDCLGIGWIMGSRRSSSSSGSSSGGSGMAATELSCEPAATGSIVSDKRHESTSITVTGGAQHQRGRRAAPPADQQQKQARKWLDNNKNNNNNRRPRPTVRSPSNKALIQTDPLFHLYLICVGLITLSILAIKCLIPGMPIYSHTVIGFAFLLAIIFVSTIYTQFKSRKINMQFRVLLWLIISASLTLLQLVDLIVPDELDSLNLESIADISRADSLSCAFTWYYTFTIIVAMTATSIFIRINVWLKFMIHISTIIFYIVINNPPATMMDTLKEFLQTQSNNWSLLDHKQELSHLFYISMIAVILHLIDRQVEYILSLNIQWNEQIESDRIESETVGEINRILLENILPPHVLKRYLYNTTVSYDQLYHESHSSCAVMFASIPNYESFYTENSLNEQGLRCLQVLNEIICDFDQLLSHPAFRKIEKIKTIGSTYMAACFDVTRRTSDCTIEGPETCYTPDIGLKTGWSNPLMSEAGVANANAAISSSNNNNNPSACSSPRVLSSPSTQSPSNNQFKGIRANQSRNSLHLDELAINNVVTMVCFATALMENLDRMNKDAWQEFRLRIGIAIGPVIAGVVGASKPTYDIWGDTVNVASRLESSGVLGRIQVSEQVAQILEHHGHFEVECRGPIEVKGKGKLTTYLVATPFDSLLQSENKANSQSAAECARTELNLNASLAENGPTLELDVAPPMVADDDEVHELGGVEAQEL